MNKTQLKTLGLAALIGLTGCGKDTRFDGVMQDAFELDGNTFDIYASGFQREESGNYLTLQIGLDLDTSRSPGDKTPLLTCHNPFESPWNDRSYQVRIANRGFDPHLASIATCYAIEDAAREYLANQRVEQ